MSAVTQLRRTVSTQLAEVSGAPRPVLPAVPRPAAAPAIANAAAQATARATAQATVIQLRPSAKPVSFPHPALPESDEATQPALPESDEAAQQALSESDEAAQQAVRQTGSTAGTDAETSHRIAGIARSVAQGALEVLGGSRPLQQMARWLDPENYERLQLRANLVRCISSAPIKRGSHGQVHASTHRHVVVRSARVCLVSPGIYEASVVAFDQKRVRAVALRIEQRRGMWRVTALEIG